ncbi:MAG: hypothetical protein JXA41_11405 [Deltaproteobacteria bacterium]|nr:hypothetical protein [Deltaproteobacteria bacterium]
MKAFAAKMIELAEKNADKIAKQWAKDVMTNTKTYSYHSASEEQIMSEAVRFYHQFRSIFFDEDPYGQAEEIFEKYADEKYNEGIPLHETMYATVLMRRHIWLYAEFQSMFVSEVEHRKAIEGLTRTILMFDYIMYVIARKYWKLMKLESHRQMMNQDQSAR